MKATRFLFGILVALFIFAPAVAQAQSTRANWAVVYGDGTFSESAITTFDAGTTVPSACQVIGGTCTGGSGHCGPIAAGDVLMEIVAVDNSGGDPGAISISGSYAFVSQFQGLETVNSQHRTAAFTRIATGSETCAAGHFTASWTASVFTAEYALVDFGPSSGTMPGSPIDTTTASNTDFSANVAHANSATATLTNDLAVAIFGTANGQSPYAVQSPLTSIIETHTIAADAQSEIGVGVQQLSSSGSTNSGTAYTMNVNDANTFSYNGIVLIKAPTGGGGTTHHNHTTTGAGQ